MLIVLYNATTIKRDHNTKDNTDSIIQEKQHT